MNVLIKNNGQIVECRGGQTHEQTCHSQLNCSLRAFLHNGARVKLHYDEIAIETAGQITDRERRVINRILRENEIYVITFQVGRQYGRRESRRPVRKFNDVI